MTLGEKQKVAPLTKGKIRRVATVSCQVADCERTHDAETSVAIQTFLNAGWTVRAGPRKTDGKNWRCPDHAPTPDENGYF